MSIIMMYSLRSLVMGEKDESQSGGNKKAKHAKYSKNEHFLPPDAHTYVCVSGGKKYLFFKKFGLLYFLVTAALRFELCVQCRV